MRQGARGGAAGGVEERGPCTARQRFYDRAEHVVGPSARRAARARVRVGAAVCARQCVLGRVHAERRGAQTGGHHGTTKASALALRLMLKRKGDFFLVLPQTQRVLLVGNERENSTVFNPYSRAL